MDSSASKNFELTAAVLHIIALSTLMLMDHLWATLLPAREWLTCAGRALPIFAFMAVEGYFHTRSFKSTSFRIAAVCSAFRNSL
ncbi:MAG: TraX family protein [Clostridium fessum]